MSSPTAAVAVVGGGLAGLVAAEAVATALGDGERTSVVVFDLGARGLGGRCGHREDVSLEKVQDSFKVSLNRTGRKADTKKRYPRLEGHPGIHIDPGPCCLGRMVHCRFACVCGVFFFTIAVCVTCALLRTRELRRFDHGAQFLSCGARDDVRWSKLVASWNRDAGPKGCATKRTYHVETKHPKPMMCQPSVEPLVG